jgi:hypothetical protein
VYSYFVFPPLPLLNRAQRSKTAKVRISDLMHETKMALSSSPLERYVPPLVGKLRIRTTSGFNVSEHEGGYKPLSNSQVRPLP